MVQFMFNCWCLFVLFCLFNLNKLCFSNFVFDVSNGTVDTEYTSLISRTSIHVYEFNSPVNSYRIETSVNSSNFASPIQIYVNHQTYEESWSLPMNSQLHPLDNVTSSIRIACPALLNNVSDKLAIRIQTFSTSNIRYSLKVVIIDSNVIQLGQQASALFNPASPTYFAFDIPVDVEIIDITLSSLSELCSLVRVTSFSCPPDFSLRSSNAVKGYDLTMTETADLRVKRSDFVKGKIMILLIPLLASQCETNVEYSMNISSENYAKNTSLKITAGNNKSWGPILILAGISLVPYVMFAIIIGFELLLIHCFPKLTRYFSVFSRVRRVTSQDCEENYEPVKGSDKKEEIELDVITAVAETSSTNVNKTTETMENESGENVLEIYKRALTEDNVSYRMRGMYYFDIINNKETKVKDLNLKSDRELKQTGLLYLFLVIIVGIFYMLPAFQVSYTELERMALTGEQDICYINFKCDREHISLRAFNHIWSNITYILLSILTLIITAVKNISFVRELRAQGLSTTGVPQIFGLYYAVSVAFFFEGIMSGIYHLCPSIINFQFDTTFIYILAAMLFVRLYKNRHPDSEVKPCAVFILLSIVVLFTCVSLFKEDSTNYVGKVILTIGITFFTFFTIYMVYNLFITELLYFYYKDCTKHKSILRALRQLFWPKYNKSRIYLSILILIASITVVVILWIPGFFASVASAIIYIFAIQMVFYIIFYWVEKFINKEFLHRPFVFFFAFFLLLLSLVFWIPAFYFYQSASSNWDDSPAVARTFNDGCVFLDYYDHHDMWHALSAYAIFTVYLSTLLIDDNLYFVQREEIRVF